MDIDFSICCYSISIHLLFHIFPNQPVCPYKQKANLLQHTTMTTYKQLQESWIRSEWVNAGAEDFGEDALVIIPEGFVSVTLDDLIKKRAWVWW